MADSHCLTWRETQTKIHPNALFPWPFLIIDYLWLSRCIPDNNNAAWTQLSWSSTTTIIPLFKKGSQNGCKFSQAIPRKRKNVIQIQAEMHYLHHLNFPYAWIIPNGFIEQKYCPPLGSCCAEWTMWNTATHLHNVERGPGVGVTKPISSVPLFSEFFNIIKTYVTYWISRLYLTGVAAAQLRWHLSNINVIRII